MSDIRRRRTLEISLTSSLEVRKSSNFYMFRKERVVWNGEFSGETVLRIYVNTLCIEQDSNETCDVEKSSNPTFRVL